MAETKAKYTPELTGGELIFAQRMLPHFLAGKSPEEAARAVLDDDARLFGALLAERSTGTSRGAQGDGSAMPFYEPTAEATCLRAEITKRVSAAIAKAEG